MGCSADQQRLPRAGQKYLRAQLQMAFENQLWPAGQAAVLFVPTAQAHKLPSQLALLDSISCGAGQLVRETRHNAQQA